MNRRARSPLLLCHYRGSNGGNVYTFSGTGHILGASSPSGLAPPCLETPTPPQRGTGVAEPGLLRWPGAA